MCPIASCDGDTPASSPIRSIHASSSVMVGGAPSLSWSSSSSSEVSSLWSRFSCFYRSFFHLPTLAFLCALFEARFATRLATLFGTGASYSISMKWRS